MARIRRPSPGTVLGGLALIVATSGVAAAAIPGSDGTVTACISKDGAVKVIDPAAGKTCTGTQTTVSFASTDATGKVANADKLDGLDSMAFLGANGAAGGDLTGTYPNPSIASGAVGKEKIADDAVDESKLAETNLWTKVANESGFTAQSLLSDPVLELSASVVGPIQLQSEAVTTSKLATDAVTSGKIATDAVTSTQLAPDS